MLPVMSRTRTLQAEKIWADVTSPKFYTETRTLDRSKIYNTNLLHPWWRDDARFLVPSGIPVAKDAGETGTDRNLIFPVKRTDLASNVSNTDVVYPVVNAAPFIVGDSINITGGTPRAITAIDYTTNELTVATTIGQAGTAGTNEIFTPNHDVAIGFLLNTAWLQYGDFDIITSVLLQGHVWQAIIHNQIFPLSATILTQLATAGISMIATTAV